MPRPTYREFSSAVAEQCLLNLMLIFYGKVLPPLHSVQQRVIKPPECVKTPFSHPYVAQPFGGERFEV